MRTVIHLATSTFFGGPERQMLGLAGALRAYYRTVFMLFREQGRCRHFVDEVARQGFQAVVLQHDTPRFRRVIRELTDLLNQRGADVLCCHGYKADLLGRPAARRAGIPVIAVSRGWTGENLRIRLYEGLDRLCLRWMDRVVCVSEGQALKVRRASVAPERVVVIRNAIRADRFAVPRPEYRERLRRMFSPPPSHVIGAAGRLSPEKGFDVLIGAAARVRRTHPDAGFVLFGEGVMRDALRRQIDRLGLAGRFLLAGFRSDLDGLLPFLDLLVLPSYTEGLPNVVLEAQAAGVPVVATAVGGTPEVVEDGVSGHLVPAGDPDILATRIVQVIRAPDRRAMGERGRRRVLQQFTFEAQGRQYQQLFEELTGGQPRCAASGQPREVLERIG
jgi:glycosyltransferase involved in cell wall biosynthesis